MYKRQGEFLLTEPDYDALVDIYTKLEFNKFLKKLNSTHSGTETADEGASYKIEVYKRQLRS